ncbi:hypothetical protein [Paenibacillus sp. FSL M7-0896]|uniref:hypothetical protein n=1 Tax=Paenibacillus sp. FSL M7-0896 TaxID=2921610 RepID=UPI0030DBEC48
MDLGGTAPSLAEASGKTYLNFTVSDVSRVLVGKTASTVDDFSAAGQIGNN